MKLKANGTTLNLPDLSAADQRRLMELGLQHLIASALNGTTTTSARAPVNPNKQWTPERREKFAKTMATKWRLDKRRQRAKAKSAKSAAVQS